MTGDGEEAHSTVTSRLSVLVGTIGLATVLRDSPIYKDCAQRTTFRRNADGQHIVLSHVAQESRRGREDCLLQAEGMEPP